MSEKEFSAYVGDSVKEWAETIENYNRLLMELSRRRKERILVVDAHTRQMVYCNKEGENQEIIQGTCEECGYFLSFQQELLNWEGSGRMEQWEREDTSGAVYRINSFAIEWSGHSAWAHIIADITDERRAATNLKEKAYHDPRTGVYNRLFFDEYMDQVLKEKKNVTLVYIDLDDLKPVNDRYGHSEGDDYIRLFVSMVQSQFRNTDIFTRVGGDEFAVILPECPAACAHQKMEEVLRKFRESCTKEYKVGFSYGLVEIDGLTNTCNIDEIMKLADQEMYRCKHENKGNQ